MHTRGNQTAANAARILMEMHNLTKLSYNSLLNMTVSENAKMRNKAYSELSRRLRNSLAQMSNQSTTNTIRVLKAALNKQRGSR